MNTVKINEALSKIIATNKAMCGATCKTKRKVEPDKPYQMIITDVEEYDTSSVKVTVCIFPDAEDNDTYEERQFSFQTQGSGGYYWYNFAEIASGGTTENARDLIGDVFVGRIELKSAANSNATFENLYAEEYIGNCDATIDFDDV